MTSPELTVNVSAAPLDVPAGALVAAAGEGVAVAVGVDGAG
ncbi:MAG: hypothetical protein ACRDGT_09855 [Candidatus Limnocylindria bacterium]